MFCLLVSGALQGSVFAAPKTIDESEVIKIAAYQSPDVKIARFDAEAMKAGVLRAQSIFDLYLTGGIDGEHDDRSSIVTGNAVSSRTRSGYWGLEKHLATGTTFSFKETQSRVSSNNTTYLFSPYHEDLASVSMTQSLGKNLFGMADRIDLRAAELDALMADDAAYDRTEAAVARARKAYWQLAYAQEKYAIAEEIAKDAQDQLAKYRQKRDVGTAEEGDLQAVIAYAALQEAHATLARAELGSAKMSLLFCLDVYEIDTDIAAADVCAGVAKDVVDPAAVIAVAAVKRHDYARMKKDAEKKGILLKRSKNALWPQIDLTATYKANGLSQKRGDARYDAWHEDHDDTFVGLSFRMPLENRAARAAVQEAANAKESAVLSLHRKEREIVTDVFDAVRAYNATVEACALHQKAELAEKAKLSYEEERSVQGRSSLDLLLRYKTDVLAARLRTLATALAVRYAAIDIADLQDALLTEVGA
jgi:outer membrane protein TolC